MIAQIQMRRGTTAEWAAANPVVLAAGEPGWDSTLEGMKVGDGSTEWAALPWIDAKNRPDINADTLDGVHLAEILLAIYPVGSIYMSISSTSPATLFGGTWAALGGRMLIGVDGTYTAGSTGGAATHVLTEAELATHSHWIPLVGDVAGTPGHAGLQGTSQSFNYSNGIKTNTTGSSNAHNNMPPYLAVYMWKRTA